MTLGTMHNEIGMYHEQHENRLDCEVVGVAR